MNDGDSTARSAWEPSVARCAAPEATGEQVTQDERHLQGVIADLWQHSETLVRQEIALAKAEYEARLVHAKAAFVRGAISAGLFYAAYLTTLATLVFVLVQWLAPWLAALIVALVACAGAVVFSWLGKQALHAAIAGPHQSPK
jgi:hypothetical protein